MSKPTPTKHRNPFDVTAEVIDVISTQAVVEKERFCEPVGPTTRMETSPLGQIEIKCNRCGKPLWIEAAYAAWASALACDACCAAHDKKLVQDARQEATAELRKTWEEICPDEYRAKIDPDKYPNFNQEAYRKAWRWDWESKRGLLLYGNSGGGKTRTMWRIVAREMAAFRSVAVFSGQAFGRDAADAAREGRERAWHRELGRETDLVVIDDLGNHKFTPTFESALFDIIETRMSFRRPVIITSNYGPRDIVNPGDKQDQKASEGLFHNRRLASAVVRRLADFCGEEGCINFNHFKQTSLL